MNLKVHQDVANVIGKVTIVGLANLSQLNNVDPCFLFFFTCDVILFVGYQNYFIYLLSSLVVNKWNNIFKLITKFTDSI